jgi:hypothetical protein
VPAVTRRRIDRRAQRIVPLCVIIAQHFRRDAQPRSQPEHWGVCSLRARYPVVNAGIELRDRIMSGFARMLRPGNTLATIRPFIAFQLAQKVKSERGRLRANPNAPPATLAPRYDLNELTV